MGVSPASVIRGFRFGFREFRRSSGLTAWNYQPFESTQLRSLPYRTVDSLMTKPEVEVLHRVKAYTEGALPDVEALALLALLADESPAAVLEIGTFLGDTTYLMARNCPGALIHTVDLPGLPARQRPRGPSGKG